MSESNGEIRSEDVCMFLDDGATADVRHAWLVVRGCEVIKNRSGRTGTITRVDADRLMRKFDAGEPPRSLCGAASYAVETMSGDRFKSLTFEETKCMLSEGADDAEAYRGMVRMLDGEGRPPNLNHVAALVCAWQSATFGPPESRTGCTARLEHIRREVEEARGASYLVDCAAMRPPTDTVGIRRDALASELADVHILLLSACAEAGMDMAVITYRKLLENRERTWSKPDADGVIEHDRGIGEESGEVRPAYGYEPECLTCGDVLLTNVGEPCPECCS